MPLTQTIVGQHRRDAGMNVISLSSVVDESSPPSAPGFERVGSFRYSKAPDRWEWSDAVARMHGYEPGTVLPTTELILSHEHPTISRRFPRSSTRPATSTSSSWATGCSAKAMRWSGATGSHDNRLLRQRASTTTGFYDNGLLRQRASTTTGFYIDITETFEADMQESVTKAVAVVEERRARIHGAIGIIRLTYGISAERAFEVLTWRSLSSHRTVGRRSPLIRPLVLG
jgi:hypothetical protein